VELHFHAPYIPSWHVERKAYSLPYLFSLPLPVLIPQTLHLCCDPVITMESQDFTAQIFYLLTTCPPLDQGAKTLLSLPPVCYTIPVGVPWPLWHTWLQSYWPNTDIHVTHTSVYACIIHPDLHVAVSSWAIDPEGEALQSFKMLGTIT
jgi:hypothetical protein